MNPTRDESRPCWWLWPNLLGLDAPLVAMVWLSAISIATGISITFWMPAVLFLAVWTIYLADRWLDARLPSESQEETLRHQFGRRYRRCFGISAALSGGVCFLIACLTLSEEVIATGLVVILFVSAYFLVFVILPSFRLDGWWSSLPGKEVGCGIGFALGTVASFGINIVDQDVQRYAIALAILATLNCLIIGLSDGSRRGIVYQRAVTYVCVAVVLVFSLPTILEPSLMDGVVALSASLLLAIHLAKERLSRSMVRVLSDVVLLTPLAVILFRSRLA